MNKDVKTELLAKMQSEMAGFEKHIQNTPEVFRNDYTDELAIRQNILKAVAGTDLSDKAIKKLMEYPDPTDALLDVLFLRDGMTTEQLGKDIKAFAERNRKPSILQKLKEAAKSVPVADHKHKEHER